MAVVTFAAGLMLLGPFDAPAKARGGIAGAHSLHVAGHARPAGRHGRFSHHRRAFNQWPFYGAIATAPYVSDDAGTGFPAGTVVYVRELPRALSCQSSQQVVTVPSEDGGTREITIRRC
jgi:hypothetical protein